ncbi:hypothetical protein EYF80_013382 [Liparis tanakae]|uniref:Uncharacterized protein n=1 Tax=Liparis tanakae TaxID=230148 RepID=A0A4Z2IFA7_9TELE|nr:hypothetical protein EYF80_013382 [Liparis tanakae]
MKGSAAAPDRNFCHHLFSTAAFNSEDDCQDIDYFGQTTEQEAGIMLAYSPTANTQREVEWSRGSSVSFLPFSTTCTTTTSAPAASSPSAPPPLLGGSSPSNSWFTSPWMSAGRRLPSLLQTVNLWLMVVAGETSDGVFLPRWTGGLTDKKAAAGKRLSLLGVIVVHLRPV